MATFRTKGQLSFDILNKRNVVLTLLVIFLVIGLVAGVLLLRKRRIEERAKAGGVTVEFKPTFRANWAHVDNPGTYEYAATGIVTNKGWDIWYCGQDSRKGRVPGDSIFYWHLSSEGASPPVLVLPNSQDDTKEDGRHACAPTVIKHSNPYILDGKPLFKMYYECARRYYDKTTGVLVEGPNQICHAVSEDGEKWQKYNRELWYSHHKYGDENTNPTPVITLPPRTKNNCSYEFSSNKHKITKSCLDDIKNYGVGHPSAIVRKINGSQQVWLYYFDSRGSWPGRVYLTKSWDGFHFEKPIETNLTHNVDVKYFDIPSGPYPGYFVATQGIDKTNYFAYSLDGINWTWYGNTTNKNSLKIGLAVDDGTHQAAHAQPTILGNEFGILNTTFVNILSGEGAKSIGGTPTDWYNTAGLWLIQGHFTLKSGSSK